MLKMRTYRKNKGNLKRKEPSPYSKSDELKKDYSIPYKKEPRVVDDTQPYVDSQPSYHDHLPKPDKVRFYGVVVKVFKDRGFGFIKSKSGHELYFRINGSVPENGQKASFFEKTSNRGPIATDVKFSE